MQQPQNTKISRTRVLLDFVSRQLRFRNKFRPLKPFGPEAILRKRFRASLHLTPLTKIADSQPSIKNFNVDAFEKSTSVSAYARTTFYFLLMVISTSYSQTRPRHGPLRG